MSVDIEAVDAIGHVPLPPYIKRDDRRPIATATRRCSRGHADRSPRRPPGSTSRLRSLRGCVDRGVEIAEITLHVGYGTFQPVRVEHVEDHRVEPERYEIGRAAAETITAALRERRRIVAVGTTTTRTLEAVAREHEGRIVAGTGWADLFIYPGFHVSCRVGAR